MEIRKITPAIRLNSMAARLGLVVFSLICMAANSDAILLGTSVTGSAKFGSDPLNYFDSTNGFVPSGFTNSSLSSPTVTISATQTEFGYLDGAGPLSVNFTDTTLTLTETITVNGNYRPQTFSFNDVAFGTLTLSAVSNSFPGGLVSSKNGSAIALAWAGASITSQSTYTAVYSFAKASPVPEPGTWIAGVAIIVSLAWNAVFRQRRALTSRRLQ